jgi:signal transduction histidine kinase
VYKRQRLKDNRLIQFRVSTSSAGDTVIIGEDLTSHKQREQELYEARYKAEHMLASRSKFIANLSHELRTPLNAIIGFSELTANEFFGNLGHPKYKDYAHDILSSAQHLLSLINDILELSKAEAGQLTLYKEDLDVIAALQQTIVLIREQAEKKQVSLTTDFHKKSYRIIADERKIKQIVLNLLSNAVKFTHTNGSVTLSTRLRKNDLLISVGDTGIGLSPNEIQQALSPFGQVINNETKDHIGTGLGLPLVKAMTEAHGGHLDIISEKGKGTTVTVTIPVA